MSDLLPPRTHPGRAAVIRNQHRRWLRWQDRPNFRSTAQRLGIAEAEVIAAHRGPCVRPQRLVDETIHTCLAAPGEWLVQVGDRHAFVQFHSRLDTTEQTADGLAWHGGGWRLQLHTAERCPTFLMRRCCRATRSHVMVCSPTGEAMLHLMPVEPLAQLALQRLWERPDTGTPIEPLETDALEEDTLPDLGAGLALHRFVRRQADDVTITVEHGGVLEFDCRGPVRPGPTEGRMISARVGDCGLGLDLDSPLRGSGPIDGIDHDALQMRLPRARWRLTRLAGRLSNEA